MDLLVLFDVPLAAPRHRVQDTLTRLGFRRLFPNAYERHDAAPGMRETERALAKVLRGQVYHLRVYAMGGHTRVVERWGK